MSLLTSAIITIVLSFLAVGVTILAGYLSIQSIAIGVGITRPILFLWIVAGVLWSIIGFRALWNYIMQDRTAQAVILALIILVVLFGKPMEKKKVGGKKK